MAKKEADVAKKKTDGPTFDESRGRKKVPMGARLDADVLEECRNAVWMLGKGWTVQKIIEEGVNLLLDRLRQEHTGGQPFPQREGEVPRSTRD